jgi:hypothetical protein
VSVLREACTLKATSTAKLRNGRCIDLTLLKECSTNIDINTVRSCTGRIFYIAPLSIVVIVWGRSTNMTEEANVKVRHLSGEEYFVNADLQVRKSLSNHIKKQQSCGAPACSVLECNLANMRRKLSGLSKRK